MKCRCRQRGEVGVLLQPFRNVCARRRWVVTTTIWPLWTGKRPRYTLYRRLGRLLGPCGRHEKISLSPGLDPWTSQRVASRCRLRLKCDGTRAETRFRLSAKRASPFKPAGASVLSNTCCRGVRFSGSNAGYTMFRGSVRALATHSISQFPLHFPSRASLCAITFQLESTFYAISAVSFVSRYITF
jgi:hypothetical protein